MCYQITAQGAIIAGINQYLTHGFKYVATAAEEEGLSESQERKAFGKRPEMQCCTSRPVQNAKHGVLCYIAKTHNQARVAVCKIAAEHCTLEA